MVCGDGKPSCGGRCCSNRGTGDRNDKNGHLQRRLLGELEVTKSLRAPAVRCTTWLGDRIPVPNEQVEDVGGDLRRIVVPFIFPMTIHLPIGTCQRVPVLPAPPSYRLMRLAELAVRPVV